MNLCIDQGNTRTKLALFKKDMLVSQTLIDEKDFAAWEAVFTHNSIQNCILSSVRNINPSLIDFLSKRCSAFIKLNQHTNLPIQNCYETPETLGKDRLAAIIGAWSIMPNKASLVVDAGTAITYDFVTADGRYLGGNIAPGLSMRFKALHEYTEKLPLINAEGEHPVLGKNTEQAIRSGVLNGMIYEIEGYISSLQEEHPELNIFFTGGDTFFFENKLKNTIFANQNLVFIGLNRIIKHNV